MRKQDAADLINEICDGRLAFLKGLNTWPTFGKGWSRRVADVRKHALAMLEDMPAKPVPPIIKPQPKPRRSFWASLMSIILQIFNRR
jgi:lysozyme family protein